MQIAVFLLYANAVLSLVFGNVYFNYGLLIGVVAIVAFGAGGLGVANERRWGYTLALAVAIGEVLLLLAVVGPVRVLTGPAVLTLAFAVALVALLLHPQSRDYQRIWFR
ncbi:MAG: hypothetical protein ACRDZ9_03920 [Acidimicrobiales bacterium]